MVTRVVSASEAFRIAKATLGRMACVEGNPADKGHDHTECVYDDASYIADLQLRLLAAVAAGDDDVILDRLADLTAAIDLER